jgi:hypothetical protein
VPNSGNGMRVYMKVFSSFIYLISLNIGMINLERPQSLGNIELYSVRAYSPITALCAKPLSAAVPKCCVGTLSQTSTYNNMQLCLRLDTVP